MNFVFKGWKWKPLTSVPWNQWNDWWGKASSWDLKIVLPNHEYTLIHSLATVNQWRPDPHCMGGQHICTNSKPCPLTGILDTLIKPSIALQATAFQHSLVATFLNSSKIQKQYFKLNPGHTTEFSLYVLPIELDINVFLSLKDCYCLLAFYTE